jgi:hypothetical protein
VVKSVFPNDENGQNEEMSKGDKNLQDNLKEMVMLSSVLHLLSKFINTME